MKDNLEEFVKSKRTEFDAELPSSNLWSNIEAELPKSQTTNDLSWVWKVAAVLFLISTTYLIFERETSSPVVTATETLEGDGYSDELHEVEGYYSQLIAAKKKEIQSYDISNEELLGDIHSLDSMYLELKNDLKVNQMDDRLINAMIRNLQLRVDILNKQLNILEQIKKVENHEELSI
ncbi:MAG: hypothetical protein JXQ96_12845 [Cyclobacteriaceae bacterium]